MGKATDPAVKMVADPYAGIRNSITDWLTNQVGKPAASYTGEMVAPMTDQETQSLSKVNDFANANIAADSTFGAGKKMVEDTLSGKYSDPTASPYYQAIKAESKTLLSDQMKTIADQAAGAGRFYSGARMTEQRRAGTDAANKLAEVLGQLSESERNRQTAMVPYAEEYAAAPAQQTLQQAQALQSLGALPRDINQALDQAIYNEYIRTTQDYPLAIANMAAGVQQAPIYAEITPKANKKAAIAGAVWDTLTPYTNTGSIARAAQ